MINQYVERNIKTAQNGLWANDQIKIVADVTIDSSGNFTLDLSKYLDDDAIIDYQVFKQGTLANGTLSGSSAVANDESGKVVIFVNQNQLRMT